MIQLTGLELRKAALEALGYRLFWIGDGFLYHEVILPSNPPFVLKEDQKKLWEEVPFGQISDKDCAKLPRIESDPAVSEPEFLKWCKVKGYGFDLYTDGSGFLLLIFTRAEPVHRVGSPVEGSTPSEARARAIVEGSRR